MKKTIIYLLVVSVLCSLLAWCLAGCSNYTEPQAEPRFKSVEMTIVNNSGAWLVVDTETGVLYLYRGGSGSSGMTVLVDAEGKPLLWEGE